MRTVAQAAALACAVSAAAGRSSAQESVRGADTHITRAAGTISVDGSLADPGWSGAARIDTWFEVQPGDNVPPKLSSVGYLSYDDRYLYAGFELFDPDPARIRAPYSDRDDISESIDYGGIVLDTRNDGRTGVIFLRTPRGGSLRESRPVIGRGRPMLRGKKRAHAPRRPP